MKNNTTQRHWQHKTQNEDKQTQHRDTGNTRHRMKNNTTQRHWQHKTQNKDKQNTTQRHWQHRTQNEEHTKHNTETLATQDTE